MSDLYNRINDLCRTNGLSIPKMCEKANIRSSVIYDLKSGKKSGISRKTAEKIAEALEITVSEIYNEKTPDAVAPRANEHIKFNELLDTLPEEDRQKVYEYLQFVADKHKHR